MIYTMFIVLSSLFFNIPKIDNSLNVSNSLYWGKIILRNEAKFKTRDDINYGSSFLIKLDTGIIACTARDFTGTLYTHGDMLKIKDFPNELLSWKMYQLNSPSNCVYVKSTVLEERMEIRRLIFYYSPPFLTFSIQKSNNSIKTLLPDVSLINNKDTVYIAGYDSNNNIRIITGTVETADNSKHANDDLRIRTEEFLDSWSYVGSPIINKEGKVIGVFNRAYSLKMNKKGNIISKNKIVSNSHYEYFVNGTTMRIILGKNYGK